MFGRQAPQHFLTMLTWQHMVHTCSVGALEARSLCGQTTCLVRVQQKHGIVKDEQNDSAHLARNAMLSPDLESPALSIRHYTAVGTATQCSTGSRRCMLYQIETHVLDTTPDMVLKDVVCPQNGAAPSFRVPPEDRSGCEPQCSGSVCGAGGRTRSGNRGRCSSGASRTGAVRAEVRSFQPPALLTL